MANLAITISNSINCFGCSPSSLWGAMQWSNSGLGKWGEGSNRMITSVGKLIDNSIVMTGPVITKVSVVFISISQSLSSTFGVSDLSLGKVISVLNTLDFQFETSDEELSDGAGYSYLFVKPDTNAENRNFSTYTELDAPSASFTCAAAGSQVWS